MPIGFFDSEHFEEVEGGFLKGDRAVDSAFFRRLIKALAENGVGEGDSLKVVENNQGGLNVSSGYAFIEGAFYSVGEGVGSATEQLPEYSGTLTEGQVIYAALTLNVAERNISVEWVSNPGEGFRARTSARYQLILARISRSGGKTVIEDLRDNEEWCGRTISEGTVRRLKEELMALINAVPGVNEVGKRPIVLTENDPGEGGAVNYPDGTLIGVL